jgi:hypothetical protein
MQIGKKFLGGYSLPGCAYIQTEGRRNAGVSDGSNVGGYRREHRDHAQREK